MPDPVTNNYGLSLPTVGGDSGSWGTVQNNSIFTPLDNILGSNFSTSITAADVTLTTTQFQNGIFVVSGTLTGNHSLIMPLSANSATAAVGGKFIVVNNGAGAFNLTVKTAAAGSQGVTVPQGFVAALYSDTVNVGYATNGLPGFAAAVNGNPNGQLAGTAASVNTNASIAFDYTNGQFWVCTVTGNAASAVWIQPAPTILRGFDTPANLAFTTAVSGNVLTVTAVAANTNTTPTVTNPIIFPFRSTTLGSGLISTVTATAALSISTFSTGATLGAPNATPFRAWITAFDNAGAVVLGLINCSSTSGIFELDETGVASSSSIGSTATSTSVFYTPNGVTLSNAAFRIVGFVSYEIGLVTAGTFNIGPTVTQVFGPGVKKPGELVRTRYVSESASQTISATTNFTTTNLSGTITPSSAVNAVVAIAQGNFTISGGAGGFSIIARNSTANLVGNLAVMGSLGGGIGQSVSMMGFDLPGTTSTQTYFVAARNFGGSGTLFWGTNGTSTLMLQELMG